LETGTEKEIEKPTRERGELRLGQSGITTPGKRLSSGLGGESATGKPLASYLSEKIWVPGDGIRRVVVARIPEWDGLRRSGPSAILRDLGRFGLVVVNEAVIDGKGIVPKNWFDDRRQARGVRIFVVATFRG